MNIDADADDEWLLLYKYDNGLIGGVIYDAQSAPRGDTSMPIPDQTSAYLVPYPLLPDYHSPKTVGYLGDDSVEFKQVYSNPAAEDASAPDRLTILGRFRDRVTKVADFWWIDEATGYGGAAAFTPGWFSLSHENPNDWTAWEDGAPYITTVWAWEPQADRSNLCQRKRWDLATVVSPTYQQVFLPIEEGDITFCTGAIPTEPVFPEGQTLAYLLDGNRQRLQNPDDPTIRAYQNVVVHRLIYAGSLHDAVGQATTSDVPIQVGVDVDFTASEGEESARLRQMTYYLLMIEPQTIKDTVHWRITNAVVR